MNGKLTILTLAVLAIGGCGKDKADALAARDSMAARDSLVPIGDAQPLGDTALKPVKPETVYVAKKPTPKPVVRNPSPAPAPAPAPAAPASRSGVLASGSSFTASAIDSVHSHYTKVGDQIRVRVSNDVTGANGRVVIPAGSIVTLAVTDIAQAKNRGEKGTLAMSARSVEINGSSYPISANASDYAYEMKARNVGVEEVAKTGAGAAAGAIVGRVIGGKTGTIIGAVGGAAAGGAIAAKSANRDIIVHAGNSVTLTLRDDFSR
ncbi:MAG: hypothetical protein V4558_00920 [Gemmatimonadota bacterium]